MGTIPAIIGATSPSLDRFKGEVPEVAGISPERLAWLIAKETKEISKIWKEWETEEDLTGASTSPCKMTKAFADRYSYLSNMHESQKLRKLRDEGAARELSGMRHVFTKHLDRCNEGSKKRLL